MLYGELACHHCITDCTICVVRCSSGSLFSTALYCPMWISQWELLVHPIPNGSGGSPEHSLLCHTPQSSTHTQE